MSESQENESLRRFVWIGAVAGLAAALFLRVWRLSAVPPGFHLDEAMDTHLALKILRGDLFFYTTEGWGREGLYYYLAAPLLYLTRDGVWGMRLASALIGVGMAGLAGWLAARLFDPETGVLTLAWTGLTFWPVFISRVAVRNISLGLVLTLAALAFWWAWRAPATTHKAGLARFGLAGLLMGLCLYTYQPARASPAIWVAFVAYAALFHRPALRARWRGLAVGGAIFALTALPLVLFLWLDPEAEGPERAAMVAPWSQLLAGNPRLVAENGLALLKMFTLRGDSLATYNLPGRPVFPGLAALPFYLGLLVCLRRWRDPACALVGLWLGVMLVPTLLTISAPHFFRSVGAIVPAMMIPAVGLASARRFLARRWGRWGAWAGVLLALGLLGQTAWLTWQDYFGGWARLEKTAINYNARETALARYLHDNPAQGATVVGAGSAEAGAPFVVSMALLQESPAIRWVIPLHALAFPAEQPAARLVLVTDIMLNNYLVRNFMQAAPATVQTVNDKPWLMAARLRPPSAEAPLPEVTLPPAGPWLAPAGTGLLESSNLAPARLPAEFEHSLALLQYGLIPRIVRPDQRLRLVTMWRVLADGRPGDLAMFAHLVDVHGQIVAQQDRFGYPMHSWKTGDVVVQVHDLELDPATPPGHYWLQIGFYERDAPGRWPVTDTTGATSDRLILDQVEVQP